MVFPDQVGLVVEGDIGVHVRFRSLEDRRDSAVGLGWDLAAVVAGSGSGGKDTEERWIQ